MERKFEIGEIHQCQLYFDWGAQGIGFGQLALGHANGETRCMNECMSRERVREILHTLVDQLVDNAIMDD